MDGVVGHCGDVNQWPRGGQHTRISDKQCFDDFLGLDQVLVEADVYVHLDAAVWGAVIVDDIVVENFCVRHKDGQAIKGTQAGTDERDTFDPPNQTPGFYDVAHAKRQGGYVGAQQKHQCRDRQTQRHQDLPDDDAAKAEIPQHQANQNDADNDVIRGDDFRAPAIPNAATGAKKAIEQRAAFLQHDDSAHQHRQGHNKLLAVGSPKHQELLDLFQIHRHRHIHGELCSSCFSLLTSVDDRAL